MAAKALRVLMLVEHAGEAKRVQEALAAAPTTGELEFEHLAQMGAGLKRLAEGRTDVVLLDLNLPDSRGIETLLRIHHRFEDLPIVVYSGNEDEEFALQVVQAGAQDFLLKGKTEGRDILRTLRYAIERHRMRKALLSLSIMDELTGLYNRRGLALLGQKQLQVADRTKRGMQLLFIDLDGMKYINDTFGHVTGDQALADMSKVLRQSFRESDILARIGGDEFVVLALEVQTDSGEMLVRRLRRNLALHNAQGGRAYLMEISIGLARYDPNKPCSMEELITRADQSMYTEKRERQSQRLSSSRRNMADLAETPALVSGRKSRPTTRKLSRASGKAPEPPHAS